MASETSAEQLLDLAESAILDSLAGRRPVPPPVESLPDPLRRSGGIFVTVRVDGELNGCIGSVEGAEPLGQAAVRLAQAAAFADPRLPPLRTDDVAGLELEVSLLTPPRPIPAQSWTHLVTEVQAGIDGVVVRAGVCQGLFLPAVWEQLPDPVEFLSHLYRKAGLAPGSWPTGMEALRFTAERHGRRVGRSDAA